MVQRKSIGVITGVTLTRSDLDENVVNRGTGRSATEAPEHLTGVGAMAGVRSRGFAMGHLLHAVAPVEPMLRRRFIRRPSEAPVAIGVTVGGCSRGDAETEPRRL